MAATMNIFLTGATGYIGGSIAMRLIGEGHTIHGLVRSAERARQAEAMGVIPVVGSLDDLDILGAAVGAADAVIHAAHSDHEASAMCLLEAVRGTGKPFLHTSGSSVVGTQAGGALVEGIYDEHTPFTPSPGRAARAALNERLLAPAGQDTRVAILCPSLIYGLGSGVSKHSMQIPWLLDTALRHGVAKHFGPGTNRWANVHIDDLTDLYALALNDAPPGAFYFAENGEASMRELCQAIGKMLGHSQAPQEMTLEQAAAEWGEGAAINTMGSNSRVRAVRARAELNWTPHRPSAEDEVWKGCYRDYRTGD